MVRVPPENVKLVAYKETVQAFGAAQSEPGQRIAFAFIVFRQPVLCMAGKFRRANAHAFHSICFKSSPSPIVSMPRIKSSTGTVR